jgi:hypothetical protein
MVLGAIKDFVITKIITAGITWLIGLLNPAAAFVKACKMIYDVIMFFIERGSQIMEFVNSILDGLAAIVSGSLGAAASLVESSLAKILPLAISFLASLLGVGGIAEKIKEIIEKIRSPITKLVTAVIGPILKPLKKLYEKGEKFVKGLVDKGKALGKKAIDKVKQKAVGLFGRGKQSSSQDGDARSVDEKRSALHDALEAAYAMGREHGMTRDALDKALPGLARRFNLRVLKTVDHGSGSYRVHGEVNPSDDSKDLPDVMSVPKAVAFVKRQLAAGKEKFDVRVATEEDAREVIAQALPQAKEHASPTPGAAYPMPSQSEIRNVDLFRQFRQKAVGFHVDVKRYNVAEIRDHLARELSDERARFDRAQSEMLYFHSNHEWAERHREAQQEVQQKLDASRERVRNLSEISSNLSAHEAEWNDLEKKGVLYGHDKSLPEGHPHRTNPHVNVEGAMEVKTETKTLELCLDLVIYIKRA